MKIRHGFVSNSSSSSFMIHGGDIGEMSQYMLKIVIEEFEDYTPAINHKKDKSTHKQWVANLKTALRRKDIKEGKLGITMPSCNYDTYLLFKGDYLYITTCNNYQWDIGEIDHEDGDKHEEIYGVVRGGYFYNVQNKMIHSYEMFAMEGDKSKCNKCNHFYGNYVIDRKGNRLCSSCYKGKLEPTDAVKMEKFRANVVKNSIASLSLEE